VRIDAKGAVLFEGEQVVSAEKLANLSVAIGGDGGGDTAAVVPFFGPTVGGETTVTDPAGLALDLSAALLAGVTYEWTRPFATDEQVHVRVVVEDVHTKGSNVFGVVAAEFTDAGGALVHRQTATFIERGAA
jgi:acyl dehydratase